ncbi:MAG: uncharacterized protein QOH20_4591 [Mycobacterium sp.]|nr:uncharacterized protein [Mycobacterium sp.]
MTYLANTIGNPLQGAIFERVLKLAPPLTRKVNVTKNIRVPMPDGVELVADLYQPAGSPVIGTVMSRTPLRPDRDAQPRHRSPVRRARIQRVHPIRLRHARRIGREVGAVRQRREGRAPFEVIGPVSATIKVRSR